MLPATSRVPGLRWGIVRIRIFKIYGLSGLEPFHAGLSKVHFHPLMVSLSNHKPPKQASFDKLRMSGI